MSLPDKITMTVSIASAAWSFAPGQVLVVGQDIDAAHATAWLAVGHALAVVEEPVLETQSLAPPPETMVVRAKPVRPRKASK